MWARRCTWLRAWLLVTIKGSGAFRKGPHLGGQSGALGARTDDALLLIGQDAQPAAFHRLQRAMGAVLVQQIVACPQKGEMVVRQPFQEGEIFGNVRHLAMDKRRMRRQVVMGVFQPAQHRLPVAHRHRALQESVAQCIADGLARLAHQRVAHQGDNAGAHPGDVHDGMESGAHPRAGGDGRSQRGIIQKGMVVIDPHQYRLGAFIQQRHPHRALGALAGFAEQRLRQGGQTRSVGAQHIVGHGAGKQRVEEFRQLRIGRQQGAGLGDARPGLTRLVGIGGMDRGHHGHGRPRGKSAVI